MRPRLTLLSLLAATALVTACASLAGSMIGGGIGRATGGDGKSGALIGGGIGMMVDIMD
jgi:hypothetical protein